MKTTLAIMCAAAAAVAATLAIPAASGAGDAHALPSNRLLAFYRSPGEAIEAVNPNGTGRHTLAGLGSCAEHPPPDNGRCRRIWGMRWSRDGERLAFFRETGPSSGFRSGLYLTRSVERRDRATTRRVAPCDSRCELDWSPDGSELVVADGGLSIVEADSGAQTRLTRNPNDESPVWSPRAPVIAFIRRSSLYTAHADRSLLTRLATFGGDADIYSLSWSPDGESLLVGGGDGIHTVKAGGSGLKLLRSVPGGVARPSWSPDGSRILFDATPGHDGAYEGEIWVVRADGTHPRRLFRQGCCIDYTPEAIWSPDGRRIAISANGGFYVANADGSRLRRFASGVIGTGGAGFPDFAWQPHPQKPVRSLASSGFVVRSSLDGKTVLPHRIRWRAVPNMAVRRVSFLIDAGTGWIAHEAPYTYAEDGYLVTSFLSPGRHRFTVRATGWDGTVATSSVVARVVAAPEPPAGLAGRWRRTVDASDPHSQPGFEDPTLTPSGTYTLTFEKRWIRDDFPGTFVYPQSNKTGNGFVFFSDYLPGPDRFHVQGEVVFHPLNYKEAEGGAWCYFGGPGADYTWSVSGDTLALAPVGGKDPCAIRGFIWAGSWTRVG